MAIEFTTTRFPHHPENVPAELKAAERWVTCDEYKVPLIPIVSGAVFAASSTNPETWRSYETARVSWQENEHIAGIGRVISEIETYVGVDLDDCLDEDTGKLVPWAAEIVDALDSYAEISPSLTGVKIWTHAPELARSYKKPGIEIYRSARYFTITGMVIGEPRPIRDASVELASIIDREFPRIERRNSEYTGPSKKLDLFDLLERADVEIFFEIHQERTAELAFSIRCPWWQEHSNGDVSGTRVGRFESGGLFFKCEHAHCGHRRWVEFRRHLEALIYLGRAPRGEGRLR